MGGSSHGVGDERGLPAKARSLVLADPLVQGGTLPTLRPRGRQPEKVLLGVLARAAEVAFCHPETL